MAAFIAYDIDDNLIWAVGASQDEALSIARSMIGKRGPVDENYPEPQLSINNRLDSLTVCVATDALAIKVAEQGGAIAWGYRHGVACLPEET